MSLIQRIREGKYNHAIVNRCYERGKNCRLIIRDIPHIAILKGEYLINDEICDYLIFIDNLKIHVCIVEMKSRNADSSKIKQQLTKGNSLALDILDDCNCENKEFDFFHIALTKRWNSSELRIIRSYKISSNDKNHEIITKECNDSLIDILRSYS